MFVQGLLKKGSWARSHHAHRPAPSSRYSFQIGVCVQTAVGEPWGIFFQSQTPGELGSSPTLAQMTPEKPLCGPQCPHPEMTGFLDDL